MNDPVCGMIVNEKSEKFSYKKKTFYFCSPTCKWAFSRNPEQFLKK